MTAPQQYDDPIGESRAQLLQSLAVLTTVGEAAARWAAVNAQKRAAKEEQDQQNKNAAAGAREHSARLAREADAAEEKAERLYVAKAFDDSWLTSADLNDVADLWRTATLRASGGDERARDAMARAETRLEQLRPNLMEHYRRFRAEDRTPAQAMQAAAYAVWLQADDTTRGPQARAHPGRQPAELRAGANGRALGPGGPVLDDLDAAVRYEVFKLAAHIDPEALDRLQRQWRSGGLVPAADAAGLLGQYARHLRNEGLIPATAADDLAAMARVPEATTGNAVGDADLADASHRAGHADQLRRDATMAAGRPDVDATPADEHAEGPVDASVAGAAADRAGVQASQQQRMGQTFPQLTAVQTNQPHLAGKAQAQIVPVPQKGKSR